MKAAPADGEATLDFFATPAEARRAPGRGRGSAHIMASAPPPAPGEPAVVVRRTGGEQPVPVFLFLGAMFDYHENECRRPGPMVGCARCRGLSSRLGVGEERLDAVVIWAASAPDDHPAYDRAQRHFAIVDGERK